MHVFKYSFYIILRVPLKVSIVLYSLNGLSLCRRDLRRTDSDECHNDNFTHKHRAMCRLATLEID